MNDGLSFGWQLFVFLIVLGSFIVHFVFLTWTSRFRSSDKPGEETTTGHVWDGDLAELNKPLPRWWLFLFHGTVVWGIFYLLLYPGSGIYEGLLGWSQEQRYEEAVAAAEERYGPIFDAYAAREVTDLLRDEQALSAGTNLYANHCAQCHGSDARGGVGFPNLTDDAWIWGGEPAQILATLNNGRMGIMPPWGAVLGGEEEVTRVAQHVLSLSGRDHDPALATAGAVEFGLYCSACHGPDGGGNQLLGAPDLSDDAWLYEPTLESIRHTISQGRSNEMPAFGEELGDGRIKVLAAYVLSLSETSEADQADADGAP